ncbi:MAG: hypothetical protein AM1032_000088 [Mycoplasmataceae bacterium]|nr:MAG: hypothetical protein AM1032_000088 [Mycoplasmataceae bacterium]
MLIVNKLKGSLLIKLAKNNYKLLSIKILKLYKDK